MSVFLVFRTLKQLFNVLFQKKRKRKTNTTPSQWCGLLPSTFQSYAHQAPKHVSNQSTKAQSQITCPNIILFSAITSLPFFPFLSFSFHPLPPIRVFLKLFCPVHHQKNNINKTQKLPLQKLVLSLGGREKGKGGGKITLTLH